MWLVEESEIKHVFHIGFRRQGIDVRNADAVLHLHKHSVLAGEQATGKPLDRKGHGKCIKQLPQDNHCRKMLI